MPLRVATASSGDVAAAARPVSIRAVAYMPESSSPFGFCTRDLDAEVTVSGIDFGRDSDDAPGPR